MSKIGSIFVAVLCLASFAGCSKKSGGDCTATIDGMIGRIDVEMKAANDKLPPEVRKAGAEMMKTMSGAMIKACDEDKWSAETLKCIDDARDQAAAKQCDATLTPEQKKHVDEAVAEVMGIGMQHKPTPPATPRAAPAGSGS
jgi:hypothetical protein